MRLTNSLNKNVFWTLLTAGALSVGGISLAAADDDAGFSSTEQSTMDPQSSGPGDAPEGAQPGTPAGSDGTPAGMDDNAQPGGTPGAADEGAQAGSPGGYDSAAQADDPAGYDEGAQPGAPGADEDEESAW